MSAADGSREPLIRTPGISVYLRATALTLWDVVKGPLIVVGAVGTFLSACTLVFTGAVLVSGKGDAEVRTAFVWSLAGVIPATIMATRSFLIPYAMKSFRQHLAEMGVK
jgi:hypothetical protein